VADLGVGFVGGVGVGFGGGREVWVGLGVGWCLGVVGFILVWLGRVFYGVVGTRCFFIFFTLVVTIHHGCTTTILTATTTTTLLCQQQPLPPPPLFQIPGLHIPLHLKPRRKTHHAPKRGGEIGQDEVPIEPALPLPHVACVSYFPGESGVTNEAELFLDVVAEVELVHHVPLTVGD